MDFRRWIYSFLLVSRSISGWLWELPPNRPLRAFASKTLQTGARSGHSNQRSFGSNCWRWSLQCTLLRFGKTMASCCGEKRTPFSILKSVYIYIYMYKYTYHIYTFSQNQNIYTHLQKIKISIYTHLQKWSICFKPAICCFWVYPGVVFSQPAQGAPG